MFKTELLVATKVKLTPEQWQAAIDAEEFLVRLVIDPVDAAHMSGPILARLDGEAVSVLFEERPLRHPALRDQEGLRHLFAAAGSSDMKIYAAGAMAAIGYQAATQGAFFLGDLTCRVDPKHLRQMPEALLAIAFDKVAEYRLRYPDDTAESDQGGPMTAVARLL